MLAQSNAYRTFYKSQIWSFSFKLSLFDGFVIMAFSWLDSKALEKRTSTLLLTFHIEKKPISIRELAIVKERFNKA